MTRVRGLIILLLALTAGGLFACGTYRYVQKQPVQAAAQLPHGLRRQVGVGPGRPGPLLEKLGRGGQVQLGQQVHRFRRQAERGPAGGEHVSRQQTRSSHHRKTHSPGRGGSASNRPRRALQRSR